MGGSRTFTTGQYINCGAGTDLNITDTVSISVWIRPTSVTGFHVIVCKGDYFVGSTVTYILQLNGDEVQAGVIGSDPGSGQGYVTTSANLSINTWYHVVALLDSDGDTGAIYVNAVSKSLSGALTATPPSKATENCVISGLLYNDPSILNAFEGQIADVRIFNRILTATEITELYGGHTDSPSGLVGQWLLIEPGASPSFKDLSGLNSAASNVSSTESALGPPLRMGIFPINRQGKIYTRKGSYWKVSAVNPVQWDRYIDNTLFSTDTNATGKEVFKPLYPRQRLRLPMGEISYFDTTGSTITISAQSDGSTNMVVVNPTTTLNNDFEFDNGGSNNGRLRYTGVAKRSFHVACTISFTSAAANDDWVIGIAKNGTVQAASKIIRNIIGSGETESTALHLMVTMIKNDYLELYVGNLTDTDNFVINTLNLFAMGM